MKTKRTRKRAIKSLLDLIGKGYKVSLDEAWKHEVAEVKMPNRIWYEQIKLKSGGVLCLYDLDKKIVKIWTPRYKWAREMAEKYPQITLVLMDKECELFFPAELAQTILKEGKGQKRREMSAENREIASARLAKYREQKKAGS